MTSTALDKRGSRSGRRPATRVAHLAHLSLDALREYRHQLRSEEAVVSYWRRLVHARIDGANGDAEGMGRLRSALAGQRETSRRLAIHATYDASALPPMPDLAVLWETEPGGGAGPDREDRLARAEAELSAYRRDLHERLDEATDELIARYREQPALALRALPRPGRRGAA